MHAAGARCAGPAASQHRRDCALCVAEGGSDGAAQQMVCRTQTDEQEVGHISRLDDKRQRQRVHHGRKRDRPGDHHTLKHDCNCGVLHLDPLELQADPHASDRTHSHH
eukprot:352421-Chlamydomonas_euryale.AAC.47